jgi:hypothetical protein
MTQIQKRQSGEIANQSTGMLKHQSPEQFKELLTAMILKSIKLNMDPMPDPDSLIGLVNELYQLLENSWPGVTPEQLWNTIKAGMAKGGAYRIRINYPTLANWLMYQRVMKSPQQSQREKEVEKVSPSINEQVRDLISGLNQYRERVKAEKGGET